MKRALSTAIFFLLACCTASAADTATVARGAALRADRYIDAQETARLEEGTTVEILQSQAGWLRVRAGSATGWLRASSVQGRGAEVAAVATLESGRSSAGNIVSAAGIRSLPRASRHALLIGVGNDGQQDDLAAAAASAAAMAVMPVQLRLLRDGEAASDKLAAEIGALAERVHPGDRVFVYFTGRRDCDAAWLAGDGVALPAAQIARLLQQLVVRADKLLVLADTTMAAAHCPGAGGISLGGALARQEGGGNVSVIEATRAASSSGSGAVTRAWTECLRGEARDLDGSGAITVDELAACTRGRLPSRGAPRLTVAGNLGYVPRPGFAPAATPSTPARVPDSPAHAVSADAVDATLRDIVAQRDARRVVTLLPAATRLRIGESGFDLTLTSSHAGYVYLVLQGSDRHSFHLLFPNDLDRDNRIEAGAALRLPRPAWRIRAQGPAGTDHILAVVTATEHDLSSLGAARDGPFMRTLLDADGRVALQRVMGDSANAANAGCATGGAARTIALAQRCSDAYGAALLELQEY